MGWQGYAPNQWEQYPCDSPRHPLPLCLPANRIHTCAIQLAHKLRQFGNALNSTQNSHPQVQFQHFTTEASSQLHCAQLFPQKDGRSSRQVLPNPSQYLQLECSKRDQVFDLKARAMLVSNIQLKYLKWCKEIIGNVKCHSLHVKPTTLFLM